MLEPTQTLLLAVIIILAIILVVLGVQVFFILKDFRKTIKKANKVLDDTGTITGTVSKPVSFLSNAAAPILVSAVSALLNLKKGKEILTTIAEDKEEKKKTLNTGVKKIKKPVRRFFRRS